MVIKGPPIIMNSGNIFLNVFFTPSDSISDDIPLDIDKVIMQFIKHSKNLINEDRAGKLDT
jgi:hypothetical protein